MSIAEEGQAKRTYAGFTSVTRRGFFGLSLWAFMAMVLSILPVLIIWIAVGVLEGIIAAVVLVLLFLPLALPKRRGRNLYQRWGGLLAGRVGDLMGSRDLANGPAGNAPDGSFRVPGLAADSELTEHTDIYGETYAVLSYPRLNHHVVVFECYPMGSSLIDQGTINRAIDHWAAWLAYLGTEQRIVAASVTVETAMDSGLRLRRAVTSRMSDIAPRFSQAVMGSILESFSASAPAINTKIAVTVSGKGLSREDEALSRDSVIAELGTIVPTLRDGLRSTGAGATVRSCTARDLIDYVRIAYDPSAEPDIEQLRSMGQESELRWEEAGPAAARTSRDHYRHDGVVSTSWTMQDHPTTVIYDTALTGLLRPESRVLRKRITLLYRPEPAELATRIVDQMENNAAFAASMNQRRARNRLAQAQAEQMSAEQARGAGLVRMGLVVTCTVPTVEDLPIARQIITTQASSSRLTIRPAEGSQDAAFTASLPLGVSLPHHTLMPEIGGVL